MCSIRETRLLLARCLASGLVALTQAFDAVVKFLAIIDIPGIASDQARRLLTTRLKYSAAKPIPMPAETGSLADRAAIRAELAWPLGMAIHRLRAHRLEACSDLLDEDFGFLPGGEVPTL